MFPGMSTPPETPAGEPAGGQAAADIKDSAGDVLASTVKGAATGGAAGAAAGALKGVGTAMVKTPTGRKIILGSLAVPVVAVCMIANMLAGASTSSSSVQAAYGSVSQNAAAKDIADPATLHTIQSAAEGSGVPWQVLGAVWKVEKDRGGSGTGPYHLMLDQTGGTISQADAGDLTKSSAYVARQLQQAAKGTTEALSSPALDTGAVDISNGTGGTSRQISSDAALQKAQEAVKTQYTAAISKLPVDGNPDVASTVYSTALNWTLGQQQQCVASGSNVTLGGQTNVPLNDMQKKYAQQIINETAARGMPQQAAIVALVTAIQESTLRMYWNPKVDGSQPLGDPSAEGTDGYSVGLYQQQVHGSDYSWGTVNDAMDPAKSTDMFLDRLAKVNGWQDMPVTVAAQTVQGSAFPDAYAKWEAEARQLVTDLKPTGTTSSSPSASPTPADTPISTSTASPSPTASPVAAGSCAGGGKYGSGGSAVGKGDDYPYRDPVGVFTTEADPWSLFKRQCVSFVAWRLNEQMGWKDGQDYPFTPAKLGLDLFGSAVDWKNTVASKYTLDHTPKVGAVAWWDAFYTSPSTITGPSGHVAIVSAVNSDGTIDIEEYNFVPEAYDARHIPASQVSGFIHVADTGK